MADAFEQFDSVESLLGASPGDKGYSAGVFENVPLLFKLVEDQPPEYMFKLRKTSRRSGRCLWIEELGEPYSDAEVSGELDDQYLFLWIRNAAVLSPEEIVEFVSLCIEKYGVHFPPAPDYCYVCRKSGEAELRQIGADVSTVCPAYMASRIQERERKEEQLNYTNRAYYAFFPIVIASCGAAWAGFWALYDAMFDHAQRDTVSVPWFLIVPTYLAVGFGLGWPLGTLMMRTGLTKRFPILRLTIVFSILTILVGEIITTTVLAYKATGGFPILGILLNVPLIASGGSVLYSLTKLSFAFAIGFGITKSAESRSARVRL